MWSPGNNLPTALPSTPRGLGDQEPRKPPCCFMGDTKRERAE